MAASGDLMFFTSHTFTVRSSLPDTTLSDPANNALVTGLSITITYFFIKWNVNNVNITEFQMKQAIRMP